MLQFTGNQALHWYTVYTLHDSVDDSIHLIWAAKIAQSLSIKEALSNPAFDRDKVYTIRLWGTYRTSKEAQRAVGDWIKTHGMPGLNKTVRFNRFTQVQCDQTGHIYKNAAECANQLGINKGQLCQHLRGNPNYKTVKSMTFRNIPHTGAKAQPVQYPPRG